MARDLTLVIASIPLTFCASFFGTLALLTAVAA